MCVPSTTGVALRPTKCAFSRCLVVVVGVFFAGGEKTKPGAAGNKIQALIGFEVVGHVRDVQLGGDQKARDV